jgi:hypothetical protein
MRVLEVSSNITTAFVDGHYEKVSNVVTPTKYYMLSGKRIAVRNASGLYYLHGDHLGSSSLTTNASGSIVSQLRYPSTPQTTLSGCTCPSAVRGLPPTRGCGERRNAHRFPIHGATQGSGLRLRKPRCDYHACRIARPAAWAVHLT